MKGVVVMTKMLTRLWKEEQGQGMTEYGLIIALVALVIIGVLVAFGDKIKSMFTAVNTNADLNKAITP